MITDRHASRTLALGLIGLAVLARLLPHPPNLTPAAALALFGAATLPPRWGLTIPLAMVILSDLAIGLYDTAPVTWLAFAATALLGLWVRRRASWGRLITAACAGSLLFFLISNFGVWVWGHGGTAYPKTFEGLVACYAAALPFLRVSLLGDLVYTTGIFGIYALAARPKPQRITISSR